MRHTLRTVLALCVLAACGTLANAAAAASPQLDSGFLVFKDMRGTAVTELRDRATGRVVKKGVSLEVESESRSACDDSRHRFTGFRWRSFESYRLNVQSIPDYLDRSAAVADLVDSHETWEHPLVTDCPNRPKGKSQYEALRGHNTHRSASLGALETDGVNVVVFQSLVGTPCDGALACVIVDFHGSRAREADMLIEEDLTRYGFQDFWSTDDETWTDDVGGRFAIVDTITHEFGHWAGLDHVERSPELTMFPFIHDGMQTLGRGDMKGVLELYGRH